MSKNLLDNGTVLTLGLVGAVAAAGALVGRRGSRSEESPHVIVHRGDRATIASLGGMSSMSRFKVPSGYWEQKGIGKYASWKPTAWLVPAEMVAVAPLDEVESDSVREKRKSAGKKASRTRETRIEEVNMSLGLPSDARTGRWLAEGSITRQQAERIAGAVSRRHEETSYDALLKAGVDRQTAREIAAQQLADRRGSRTTMDAKSWLQQRIKGSGAQVIFAEVKPWTVGGEEYGEVFSYALGGYTDLDEDNALRHRRDHELHRIVTDALGMESNAVEQQSVMRDRRGLADNHPGYSVVWEGTIYGEPGEFTAKMRG